MKNEPAAAILCLDVPENTFAKHEVSRTESCWQACIPAPLLNAIGRPRLFDHPYTWMCRRAIVGRLELLEQRGNDPEIRALIEDVKRNVEFLDRHGWNSVLRLTERGDTAAG